ncbi:GntR family transcriptional regulator [Roseococcus pinisoli]|uniref:GntR family transcriptional regulator n=1 Tax=Roseococcus pinisoli TaxID=2835040 RepID=A0ABS5Q8I9_9PROT|nr:GntR family transcriptional regulator [Roseococcus pinisoli]MBS7809762.1 GntR family transcriptional regulator [Roseococcus pinisoli]
MTAPLLAETSALHRELARDILLGLRARGAVPGEKLSRLALAKELGVSRTPVEGAVALLESLGVVETEGRAVRLRHVAFDPEHLVPRAAEESDAVAELLVALARDRRSGALPEEVSERLLQSRYAVGRAVVAATLRQLSDVGAVMRNRGHGWRFGPAYSSAEDRAASYRFRLMLEPTGLLEPGFSLPSGWVAGMRRAHERFLGRAWKDTDPVHFFETNAAFHRGLAEGSGNRFLVQAIEQQNQLRRFSNYDWQRGMERVRTSAADHLGILEALEVGDRPEAAERMRHHLAGTAKLAWRSRTG